MVRSAAANVDEWREGVEPARGPAMRRLRQLCLERLPGWSERMQWGMPGYGPEGGDASVSFNSQKRHIAFYPGETAVQRFADRLGGVDCGKGCVRYRTLEQMDFGLIGDMLDDIHARGGAAA